MRALRACLRMQLAGFIPFRSCSAPTCSAGLMYMVEELRDRWMTEEEEDEDDDEEKDTLYVAGSSSLVYSRPGGRLLLPIEFVVTDDC